MKTKIWKKIFKNKSSKESTTSPIVTASDDLDDENNIDPFSCETAASFSTSSGANSSSNSKTKFSKMVNSFTLKRNSNKENNNCYHQQQYGSSSSTNDSDVAITIIRNAELTSTSFRFNSDFDKNYGKRRLKTFVGDDDDDDNFLSILGTSSKLITPSDEIPLLQKRKDFNDPTNFPVSPEPTGKINLKACPICSRKFNPDTFGKHVGICEMTSKKKRKAFDSSRQRIEGTDLATYALKKLTSSGTPIKSTVEARISPRIQVQQATPPPTQKISEHHHTNFSTTTQRQNSLTSSQKKSLSPIANPTREEIRAKAEAKRSQPPPAEQCPHCARCFGIKAYDRHVEWCKEKAKSAMIKNNSEVSTAKNRLEARTKYRAPCPKAKRDAIRTKYSADDGHSIDSENRSAGFLSMSNSLSSSFMSDGPIEQKSCSSFEIDVKQSQFNKEKSFVSVDDLPAANNSNDNLELHVTSAISGKIVPKKPPMKIAKKSKPIKSFSGNRKIAKNSKESNDVDENLNDIANLQFDNENFGLIGRGFNAAGNDFENDDNIADESNDILQYDDAISSDEIIPETKECENDDYVTKEDIIPLVQNNNCYNFDDTPIKPMKKFDINKMYQPESDTKLNGKCFKTILPPIKTTSKASISSDEIDKFLNSSDCKEIKSSTSFLSQSTYVKKAADVTLPKIPQSPTSNSNVNSDNFWMKITNQEINSNHDEIDSRNKEQFKYENYEKFDSYEENPYTPIFHDFPQTDFSSSIGFSDKYDPFLSAKRQLEELCSPFIGSMGQKQYLRPLSTEPTTTKPSSLYASTTTRKSPISPLTTSMNTKQTFAGSLSTTPTPVIAQKSNFRRTSSLRSPRKISRPLFVSTRTRPSTIQRGISDEGPISTNFIKTEDYDEMPVKSACINNYAIRDSSPQKQSRSTSRESSPLLVVKRDANANVNRRNLRLNLDTNPTQNPVMKTDSLAVFLKYENDLTKNPSQQSMNETLVTQNIITTPSYTTSNQTSPMALLSNLSSEKALKDKNNILNKQNSFKSDDKISAPTAANDKEKLALLKSSLTNILESNNNKEKSSIVNENNPSMTINKILPIKLEPIKTTIPHMHHDESSPVKIPSTLTPIFPNLKSTPMKTAINNNFTNLNAIITYDKKDCNFIDPKLINVCDNLQIINKQTTTAVTKLSSSSSSDLCNSSQDSVNTTKKMSNQKINDGVTGGDDKKPNLKQISPNNNRHSNDKKNLLKRQIRLNKNQFLYDASPSDSEPSPDIQNFNDSTTPLATTTTQTIFPLVESEKQFDSLLSPCNNPIFNDFDFEEFLSTFETSDNDNNNNDDDDEFPGFKDCKEFLINRCLNMRSTNVNKNNQKNLTRSTRMNDIKNECNNKMRDESSHNDEHDDDNDDDDDDVEIYNDKREIFISIETDQNDNETLNPCPNDPAIKNAKIEEINGNDNKFTKIETYHLPIYEEQDESLTNKLTTKRNMKLTNENYDLLDKNVLNNNSYPIDSDEVSSSEYYPAVDGRKDVKSKTSADSAYGSLSRQSPSADQSSSLQKNSNRNQQQQTETSSAVQQQIESLTQSQRELYNSSSSSENSLPPINSHQQQFQRTNKSTETNILNPTNNDGGGDAVTPNGLQMSKFCHECGNRFLISQAKFCMDCGVKRMTY